MRSRRGRGEGAVYQRESDGRWCASITIGYDANGKRRRRVVYGDTKQAVREELSKLHSASIAGALGDPSRMTVKKYLTEWLAGVQSTIRPTTQLRYEGILRLHVSAHIGGMQVCKLTPSHIQALYARIEAEGGKPRTREMVHVTLKKALKQAVQWNLLARNPCEAVQKPRVPKRAMHFYDQEQIAKFLAAAKDDRLYALYALAITSGMRESELVGLQWHDVNLKAGTVSVQRQMIELRGKMTLSEPKSAKGRRLIDLPKFTVDVLKAHRERMLAEGHHQLWVFCDTEGGPLRQSNFIQRSFEPIMVRAELPRIRFHDLRHTAATLLFSQGVHPKVVQERLGHATIGLTLDTYSHVIPTMQKDAATKLDAVLPSGT